MGNAINYMIRLHVNGQIIEAMQTEDIAWAAIGKVMLKHGISFCEQAEAGDWIFESVHIDDEGFDWSRAIRQAGRS